LGVPAPVPNPNRISETDDMEGSDMLSRLDLSNSEYIESVTFKMTHFAFVIKGQIPFVIILILTLIDKCKMCHFECHGLIYYPIPLMLCDSIELILSEDVGAADCGCGGGNQSRIS
jgi:hypothetical protein